MRKLKLQMQISFDGFVTIEEGAKNFNWDEEVRAFSTDNLSGVDTILLGANTAHDFIPYWKGVANNSSDKDYKFGKLLTDIPKIVFSAKLKNSEWENTAIANGNIVEVINNFKNKQGKDMLVYGGASFVSSLVEHNLIDEYFFLVNPIAAGKGESIFQSLKNNFHLKLIRSEPFSCGTILSMYKPKN